MSSSPMVSPSEEAREPSRSIFGNLVYQISLHIGHFSYDKAKEISDRERESAKSQSASGSSPWTLLMSFFSQLALGEKQYMALSFLQPKGFLRKESSLKAVYDNMTFECHKVDEAFKRSSPSDEQGRLSALIAGQCAEFTRARSVLIDFYEKLCNFGTSGEIDYMDILMEIDGICTRYLDECLMHPSLEPLKRTFGFECITLKSLLLSLSQLQIWSFYDALIPIRQAKDNLDEWNAILQKTKEAQSSYMTGWFKSQQDPHLYQWLLKLKHAVTGKYTLYFYEVLLEQSTTEEMKKHCVKLSVDYVSKIQGFQKKSDAVSVNLVFNATGLPSYKGPGFHLWSKSVPQVEGKDLYPSAFSCPGPYPEQHWPNVIMILAKYDADLSKGERVIHFYDHRVNSTYFLCRIDPRMTMVAIYESKRSEKDSYVHNFMMDTCTQLRTNKVFGSLRPGFR